MRPLFIAGNWKMNPNTEADAVALAEAVKAGVGQDHAVRVALCPPSVYLHRLDSALSNSPIGVGAQNMHPEPSGAYTGELSAAMLVDVGCTHVILGHSERRHGLGETDAFINRKLHAALKAGLIPILCIGETLEEREQGRTEAVVASQLDGSLDGLEAEPMAGVVLAYEPVWAIGTGRTATPEQAQEVHAFIRGRLAEKFSEAIAARVVIQYGGSVKADNAADLLARPDIDGALVGGASLKAPGFLGIIEAARAVTRAGKG
ncbi:triose-phosphate isomerase [Tautonia plasticadhaerens]|uniref:Triosephosphate isomerase n=1 Tax=Tautonia plasticadhaerens TaxID=2527974 RepID=A0A518GV87_9BACT|nr:triose-phosphate isomerase [Tautonia plasticadhaerens]QDV32507.1 Triosephosphate isomerase [Tautonia plasticadhaerens]